MKLQLLAGIIAAAALVAAAGFLLQNPEVERRPLSSNPSSELKLSDFSMAPVLDIEVERRPLVSSLSGTDHGVLLRSQNDQLVVTAGLKDLFDYYLSASGEESFDQIKQRIQAELARQLSATALDQALQVFADYLEYKHALVRFDEHYAAQPQLDGSLDSNGLQRQDLQRLELLTERQKALVALQQQILGVQVADIFFAFDHQLDEHTLARARILNSDMTATGKEQALINLQAELPIQMQVYQQRNNNQAKLANIENDLQLSDQDKFNQRAQVVGEDAAQRLAQLDKQRLEWQLRLDDFKRERNALLSAGLAPEDYSQAYNKLLNQHFRPHEQLRAKALTQ